MKLDLNTYYKIMRAKGKDKVVSLMTTQIFSFGYSSTTGLSKNISRNAIVVSIDDTTPEDLLRAHPDV